jgi:hypothetical protein
LRAVKIQAEIRGEARVVPEPASGVLFPLGLILLGLVAAKERSRHRLEMAERRRSFMVIRLE